MFLELANLLKQRPICCVEILSKGGTDGLKDGTVMRSEGGPCGLLDKASIRVGHCMQ